MLKMQFKAAGVSFEGRQETLKRLAQVNPWRDVTLKLTQYEGEDAIMLQDYETKEQLGWVPKALVANYKNVHRMAGRIVVGRSNTGLQLFPHKLPSQKQYWTVRRYCEARNKPLPPCTLAAYESMFAVIRIEK